MQNQQVQIGKVTYRVQRVYSGKRKLTALLAEQLTQKRLPKSGIDDRPGPRV